MPSSGLASIRKLPEHFSLQNFLPSLTPIAFINSSNIIWWHTNVHQILNISSNNVISYIMIMAKVHWAFLVAQTVKNTPAMQETQVWSLGQGDPLEEEMAHTPVFLPGEFHGQRSLGGYSPWGSKDLDTTEHACTLVFTEYLLCADILKNHFPLDYLMSSLQYYLCFTYGKVEAQRVWVTCPRLFSYSLVMWNSTPATLAPESITALIITCAAAAGLL